MHVFNLAKQLQLKGHSVTIYCSKYSIYERGFYSTDRSIEAHNVEGITIKIACSYRGLERVLVEECNRGYDVLHFHAYRSIPIRPNIIRQLAIPVVFTPHAIFPPTSILNYFTQKVYDIFLGKPLLNHSNVLIALNKKNMSELKQLGAAPEKITIIPNSINWEEFIHIPSEEKFREEYEITEEYILFNGRIVEHKGVHILLEAMEKIQHKSNLKLVIIGKGEGKYLNYILKLIRDNRLENKVLIINTLERKMQLSAYNGAKVFVLPSFHEGLPTVLLEAMAMGKVCIASKMAGDDLIIDNINGYSFSTGNPTELSKMILEIDETDPKILKKIKLNAKNTVKNEYSWAINVSKIETAYTEVMRPKVTK